jgi:S-adenosylmethionine:tRNA ribosyltransferase-isomerase
LLIELVAKQDDQTLLMRPAMETTAELLLDQIGWVPIPPYIRKGKPLPYDKERYQTVYAARSGSIAAPTAGLHLTPELLETVQHKGTGVASVTLHVGLGTFKPITTDHIEDHHMHSEWCSLSAESASSIQQCRRHGGRIIAVGTTSVRVLESVPEPFQTFETSTSLFIRPPYRFRNVDALLTNFHFPKSTLLILVRTFGGDELIQAAYREAIRERYRFFSYGDAMLIY